MTHNYIYQKVDHTDNTDYDRYFWLIYCTQCGHVAWYGNATNEFLKEMQANLPRDCAKLPNPYEKSESEAS